MQQIMSTQEYKELIKPKYRKQSEGLLQKTCGQLLNGPYKYRLSPNLLYWTYSGAGEKKSLKTGALQKKKGLQKGDNDYRFEILKKDICGCGNYYQYNIYLEAKSKTGTLTLEQKLFREKHKYAVNTKCYVFWTTEEFIKILEQEGVLI